MIDYLKLKLVGINTESLLDNDYLVFTREVDLSTGEIVTTNKRGRTITGFRKAVYKDLTFKIYDTWSVFLYGSLHKYHNGGSHNYDNFYLKGIKEVLNDLQNKFNIHPSCCVLKNAEVGVNVKLEVSPNDVLEACLLHKTSVFERMRYTGGGRYIQCKHSQYIVKIYNKTQQYLNRGLAPEKNILRFELKFTKMEYFNSLGIYNLDKTIHSFWCCFKCSKKLCKY